VKPDITNLSSSVTLTPSSIIEKFNPSIAHNPNIIVPKATGNLNPIDPEEFEREKGNIEFKNGNFAAAVKAYTKCLGLKVCLKFITLHKSKL
jgi:hypothetical protein